MSDIRFNQWLHQSGTGGVSQDHIGNIGIGTTNPSIVVSAANTAVLNVGVITANNLFVNNAFNGDITGNVTGNISGATGTFSGNVDIADKIIHTGDTDTAMRFPADNTFAVDTAGSERLRITSGGLVGINTDIPSNTFQVVDTGGTAGSIDFGPSANRGRLYASSNGIFVGSVSNHDLILRTNNTERLRVDSTGKVGIGTENPLNGVDIVQSDSRTRVTAYGHIITRNHNHSVTNYWSIAPRNGGELDIAYGAADSDGTVSADLVTIKSDGKIGQGISNPSSAFHGTVSSGGYNAIFETTANGGEALVTIKGKKSDGTVRSAIFKYDNADMIRLATPQSIPMRFETNDVERMRILPTGGLTFNGDTAQANALNDYEEGTLSWILQRDDNIGAGSNVNTRVTYTKIGNRVYISGYIYTQNTGQSTSGVNIIIRSASNTSNVATLPYLPNQSGGLPVTGTRTISDNYRNMAVTFQENSSTVYLFRDDGDNNYVKNTNNVSVAQNQTHLVLQFCGSYTTNS